MADQRNRSPEDLIYFFQQNYLHQMRRKTHQTILQVEIQQSKFNKSHSTHIPQPIASAQNLFDAYIKERQQKREINQIPKPQSKSSKYLNQILINNQSIIKRNRFASRQQQPDKSIEQIISRKKSVNLTISDSNQKRTIEKSDWLIRPGKVHVDRKQIKQLRHETIFRETFNRLNGWQIDNDNDTEF
ncbi:unnamed protein product (macronuclear) [Paramecium tetraurelia]|uniref:Uncharacterized protein n=1 Tax=Paramecium tetraurelia TaxID=5888 RepID=A0CX63_PARTE|nr:uncharacterized protein GSPATT00001584001 [Paramecium tetraurelia]CAK75380.1 unnamed protein product [Paramecium tetraurelia]|eukprot:XP_001442777.1 hypothetical protein (macronuclear) [Paramecium tetraurelia strain d4-2]